MKYEDVYIGMRFLGLPWGLRGVIEDKREDERNFCVKFDNGEWAIIRAPQIFKEKRLKRRININTNSFNGA